MTTSTVQNKELVKEIAIFWSIEDVQSIRNDLTDEKASIVLLQLKEEHDADIGINWETIENVANDLFPN